MRKAVKQAPVVQSVAAAPGGGSRALITVNRQIQEVRQEFDRMLAAKEPLWFSMPEPVDHNPLHFRFRPIPSFKHSMFLMSPQVFVERVRTTAAAELLGGWQIRGRPSLTDKFLDARLNVFNSLTSCFLMITTLFLRRSSPANSLFPAFWFPFCSCLSVRVPASWHIPMPFYSYQRSNLPQKHSVSLTPASRFAAQLFTPLFLLLLLPLPSNARLQMRCLTRIFHPNIDDTTGKICASFLDDTKWVPTHTILSMLQSMYVVMYQGTAFAHGGRCIRRLTIAPDPNGHDPLPDCKHAAELLLSNPEEFKRRVRRHMQEVLPFAFVFDAICSLLMVANTV
jgi:hypothetical protein